MPITEPTDTIEMLVTATTRRLATRTGMASGSSTFTIRVNGLYPTAVAASSTAGGTASSASGTARTSRATVYSVRATITLA
jgi:hypothetical protein